MIHPYKIGKNPKAPRSSSQPAAREKEIVRDFDREIRRTRFLQQAHGIKLTSRTAELMEILFEMRS